MNEAKEKKCTQLPGVSGNLKLYNSLTKSSLMTGCLLGGYIMARWYKDDLLLWYI